jgi:hypothetical protein
MSDNFHADYQDAVTHWAAADMNAPLKELDAAVSMLARGKVTVIDKDLAAPPVGPSDLDAYIVAGSATGAWAGKEKYIAFFDASKTAWKFSAPAEGLTAYVQDEDTDYRYGGSLWAKQAPYIVAAFYPGLLANAALCLRHTAPLAVDFPADLTGSQSKAGTAATAEAVFSVKKNGTEFGTITFAIAGATGSFAAASATSLAAGDVLAVVAPAAADASLADVDFQLKGAR